jgi:hypothetical protein
MKFLLCEFNVKRTFLNVRERLLFVTFHERSLSFTIVRNRSAIVYFYSGYFEIFFKKDYYTVKSHILGHALKPGRLNLRTVSQLIELLFFAH